MAGPDLIIGAPVHERGWVLREWFYHLSIQDLPWERVEIVLNYGESKDETLEIIEQAADMRPWVINVLYDDDDDHVADRKWNPGRYETMVRLRNDLLNYVRERDPAMYLSLDTDILLAKGSINGLVREAREYGADGISPLMWMTPNGEVAPNAMVRNYPSDQFHRARVERGAETRGFDAVFAGVLMNRDLYQKVDYAGHRQGEDLGWALGVQAAGLSLALCPSILAKHVMEVEMLNETDVRLGW